MTGLEAIPKIAALLTELIERSKDGKSAGLVQQIQSFFQTVQAGYFVAEEKALTIQEENLALKRANAELVTASRRTADVRHVRSLYYASGDPVPYCPRCFEIDGKLLHLFGPASMMGQIEAWQCYGCGYDYSAEAGASFRPFNAKKTPGR